MSEDAIVFAILGSVTVVTVIVSGIGLVIWLERRDAGEEDK
jgi:hypothetical protein